MANKSNTKANTGFRNEKLFCFNCGGEFALKYPIEIDEMIRKTDSFNILHRDCPPTWKEPKSDQSKDRKERAMWWISHGERGLSSEAMWYCLMGLNGRNHHPCDPDDFKRCYKLLESVPEWKLELNKLKTLSPVWIKLVDNWDKLTDMYEQNLKDEWKNEEKVGMYDFMQKLGC